MDKILKFLRGLVANWKTTLAGLATLFISVGAIGPALLKLATGDFTLGWEMLMQSWDAIGLAFAAFIGLFARDANKTPKQ